MPGNPDSGKPRIHPGMTIRAPSTNVFKEREQRATAKIKPLPRATKKARIAPATPRGTKTLQQHNKRQQELRKILNKKRSPVRRNMFRTDI